MTAETCSAGGVMGDLVVIYRATGELIPYVRNARTHSDAQVAQIAGSIREFGFTPPLYPHWCDKQPRTPFPVV